MHKPQQIEKVLKNFPIEDIWGIGRKYSSRFKNYYGLTTAYDFYMKDEPWIHSEMGITGVRTWRELHSIPSISFEDAQHNKKQIMVSRSFSEEIASIEELSTQVSLFCSIATEKLRKQHSCCNSAMVFIRTNRFKNNISQQFEGKLITFPVATNSTIEINAAVIATLHQLFRPGVKYKKAGVMLTEIIPDNKVQLSFFDDLDGYVLALVLALGEVHRHPVREIPVDLYDAGIIGHIDLSDRDIPYSCIADDEVC